MRSHPNRSAGVPAGAFSVPVHRPSTTWLLVQEEHSAPGRFTLPVGSALTGRDTASGQGLAEREAWILGR